MREQGEKSKANRSIRKMDVQKMLEVQQYKGSKRKKIKPKSKAKKVETQLND